MDKEELKIVLEDHEKWINHEGGKCAKLSGASLIGTDLSGIDLRGAYLRGADLRGTDLRGADLRGAYLLNTKLSRADLSGAYLSGADLSGTYLRGAYLRGTNLRGAILSGSNLSGAYLIGADLSGADLSGVYLSGADLSGTKYNAVIIKRMRVFSGLYKYPVVAIITEGDIQYIGIGCEFHTREDWENNFWNNLEGLHDGGSEIAELRKFTPHLACQWLDNKARRTG